MEKNIYKFYDWLGNQQEEYLDNNQLGKNSTRCPRDGVRLIGYHGDPHVVVECPNCQWSPLSWGEKYNKEKDIANIKCLIINVQKELDLLKATLSVVSDDNHPIKLKNLET